MSNIFLRNLFPLILVLGGCAIHPLPENFAGYKTKDIVAKVRCEARHAVHRKIVALFEISRHAKTRELAESVKRGKPLKDITADQLDKDTRAYIEKYDGAAIAYEFTFNIVENNDLSGGFDVLRPFSNGTASLGITAENKRQRENTRNFRITDTFQGLIKDVPDSYCEGVQPGENWMYPIVGEIGLAELIGTFLDLNQSGNLTGDDLVPTMSDTLEFETKLLVSAGPKIELISKKNITRLSAAHIDASISRTDKHKVAIALSLPPERVVTPPKKPAVRKPNIAARSGKSPAEKQALDELSRQDGKRFTTTLQELLRQGNLR